MAVSAIPEGMHSITPHLVVKGASEALDFYKKAFGAEEVMRMPGPGGVLMHAEFKIGDSIVFMADEFPDMGGLKSPPALGGTTVTISIYTEDCDALFSQAVSAGAKASMPPADMFWGDRYGKVTDPFGHEWAIATHKENLTPEQIGERAQKFFAEMGQQQ